MKDKQKELISQLEERLAKITEKVNASESPEEVAELTARAAELQGDIESAKAILAEIEAQEERAKEAQAEQPPKDATLHNPINLGNFKKEERKTMNTADMEYRQAFMAYAQNGTPIPAELRAANSTADTGAAIPMTVMNEVINTVRKRYGNLYNKVRKTAVKGGVKYPIGALQASFKWISETTVSPNQKAGTLGSVIFAENVAEIRIATTFLANIVTLDAFEAKLTEVIAIAYLQAMDSAIVSGSGDGAPLGILNDTRVTNTVTMTAADMGDWTAWRKKFFAKLPLGYRSGEFIFPVSTVDSYLSTMADNNNNPIFMQATGLVVNDGDAINPNGRFFGREISLVEEDILPDFDTASANDVIGIYWQPEEYAINENFGFTMRRYFDETTNEWVDKALVVVDGKVLNPTGYYLIKKG